MEKRNDNEVEKEKEEASNSPVLFSALLKDVASVLDFMERLKNKEDQKAVVVSRIENLKFELALICTYVQLSYSDSEHIEDKLTTQRQQVEDLHRSILDDHVLAEEQLDFLLLNLHCLSKFLAEKRFPLVTQYEILQKMCVNMKDFHGLIVNGCVEPEIAEYVLPRFQLMAEKVGHFIWELLTDESRASEDPRLLLKIIPIELEVIMHIYYTNLKASTSTEVGRFIRQLLETSPDILREYLIHLQEHMVTVLTPRTSGARNIHVMIEFLLIVLTDVPKDFIHPDKLFDLLSRVGALTRDVSILIHGLEEKSMKKESSDETNRTTLDLLKDIELLKGDLMHVYLKAPDSFQCCFPMSDGPLFMHLLLRHFNDLLDSNSYSIVLIREEINLVKENLEFIKSFVNIEQELFKNLGARVLDVAYEAKVVIDSIIVRDNGLLHLIFSLPATIKKIELIKEEVSNLHGKIPENRGLIVVNSPNKLAESNSSPTGKIIVSFEEETNWIIEKLNQGPADLDVISITGMPGSGKTTLAYKVYNDELVSRHFDFRAWCTVGQKYDKKKLFDKNFNQVHGSDSKFSENIDVANKLRKQLYGKRYLIVLDDLWDTSTWHELTRPFPEVKNGSRIMLTTREKKVALHGKRQSDPLILRLLSPGESWKLLEKRAFGKESCPDELLDVGKEIALNCKGLPLVVDLIAGVIARKEKKKTVWLEVRNNLSSFILNSEVEVMKVIALSYDHLPDYLKPCLIYLASYQKDSAITVCALKVLWHDVGLVELTEMKSVDEVMDVYLNNLISSSLVNFFDEIGDEPTCQLHDLIHEFCLIKARKEKVFDIISSSAPSSSSSSDLLPSDVTIYYQRELFGLNNVVLFGSKKRRHFGKHLYSLTIDGYELDDSLSDTCHVSHLRLLKVLLTGLHFYQGERFFVE